MNFDEMVAQVLPIFPNATFDEDMLGEVVIATGMRLDNDTLIPFEGMQCLTNIWSMPNYI